MESKLPEILDARGDQGALEIKSPRNRALLHSDVDYILYLEISNCELKMAQTRPF